MGYGRDVEDSLLYHRLRARTALSKYGNPVTPLFSWFHPHLHKGGGEGARLEHPPPPCRQMRFPCAMAFSQAINLGDRVSFKLLPDDAADDEFECNMPGVPTDRTNLVLRTIDLMREKTGIEKKLRVRLEKKVRPFVAASP